MSLGAVVGKHPKLPPEDSEAVKELAATEARRPPFPQMRLFRDSVEGGRPALSEAEGPRPPPDGNYFTRSQAKVLHGAVRVW